MAFHLYFTPPNQVEIGIAPLRVGSGYLIVYRKSCATREEAWALLHQWQREGIPSELARRFPQWAQDSLALKREKSDGYIFDHSKGEIYGVRFLEPISE